MIKNRNDENTRLLHEVCRALAYISGLFIIIVSIIIIASHLQMDRDDPLDTRALDSLRRELRLRPGDTALKETIRAMDLRARKIYFDELAFTRKGSILLLCAAALFLASVKAMRTLRPDLPYPGRNPAEDDNSAAFSRKLAAAGGIILLIAALIISLLLKSGPTQPGAEPEPPAPITFADHTEIIINWPCFRGPYGNGLAQGAYPTSWNGAQGSNIIWKVPNPTDGFNSPVIWNNKLFISGGNRNLREIYCLNTDTGAILWKQPADNIPGSQPEMPEMPEEVGYAPSTMATDGERIMAIFPNGDVICLDFEGNRVWARNIGVPKIMFGLASSLVTFENILFIQLDTEVNPRIMALDTGTGRIIWEQTRVTKQTWSSPIMADTGSGMQLVLNGNPSVKGYNPITGDELWSFDGMLGEVAPSPAAAGGRIFAGTQYATLLAISPKPTPTVLWKKEDDIPDLSSPVANDKMVIMVEGGGVVTCMDAEKGNILWQEELAKEFYSSPVIADGLVYAMDREGVMHIFRAADKFELIGKAELGEHSDCTPAYVNGRIYIRTKTNVYCIGKPN